MKALTLAFVLFVPVQAAGPRQVRMEAHVFPGLERMDGNWAALCEASDGKVYAGLAYHGGDGHFACFDLNPEVIHDLGNLTELAGESALRRGPQSKVHAKFGE